MDLGAHEVERSVEALLSNRLGRAEARERATDDHNRLDRCHVAAVPLLSLSFGAPTGVGRGLENTNPPPGVSRALRGAGSAVPRLQVQHCGCGLEPVGIS